MIDQILGAKVDARIVAAARAIIIAAIVAAIGAAQKVLTDPSLEDYFWVPIAGVVLRAIEGWFDHADSDRTG